MRHIALLFFSALPLLAGFFPATVTTTVAKADKESITLAHPLPVNGMSGVVIHNFGGKLQAVTGYIEQLDNQGKATLLLKDAMPHEKLPSIKTPIQPGDSVIGGYLYDRVLLMAPDAANYEALTQRYDRQWVHPDLFATYLANNGEEKPTKENLKAFARAYQIGLICIVKRDQTILLDPLSGKVVSSSAHAPVTAEANYPFYRRLKPLEHGLFSSEAKGDYYNMVEEL